MSTETRERERVAHTPGPWAVHDDGEMVCKVKPDGSCSPLLEIWSGWIEYRANARIIAASPTMYDFIARRAADGDTEARAILEGINATS